MKVNKELVVVRPSTFRTMYDCFDGVDSWVREAAITVLRSGVPGRPRPYRSGNLKITVEYIDENSKES